MSQALGPAQDVVETLFREHDVIQSVLQLLKTAATMLDEDKSVPEGFQCWSVEFFRNYADRFHHAKEELVLFPAIVKKWGSASAGMVNTLVAEHAGNRVLITQMGDINMQNKDGCRQFAKLAHRHGNNLRDHIFRENNDVFRAAQHAFTKDEMLELMAAAEKAEKATGAQDYPKLYIPAIDHWDARIRQSRTNSNG
jgi:hemerythrin-like domain-containing protein